MGVPDDANPLNRRLPAEVVSRRHKVERKKDKTEKEEAPLVLDRSQVLAMKPEQRTKWLSKVLQKCQEGKVAATSIYDIVAHTKFAGDTVDKVGGRMYRVLHAHLALFSQKQQRYLESECKLAQLFRDKAWTDGNVEGEREAETGDAAGEASASALDDGASAPAAEDMDIPALWESLRQLTAARCQAAIDALDSDTKDRLEDYLEARMRARSATVGGSSAGSAGPAAEPHAAEQPSAGAGPALGASRSRSSGSCGGGGGGRGGSDGEEEEDARMSRSRSRGGRATSSGSRPRRSGSEDKADSGPAVKRKDAKGKQAKDHAGGGRRRDKERARRGRSPGSSSSRSSSSRAARRRRSPPSRRGGTRR